MSSQSAIDRIRNGLIGAGASIPGPFGMRPLVYADYTASGRSLDFIEERMSAIAAPFYANTHTETSYTGLQTTRLREAARAAVRRAVGAGERHAVIFCGSGATAAVNKLVTTICDGHNGDNWPTVFIGPYEHHSNDLPWREANVRLVRIPLDENGQICLGTLEAALEAAPKDAPRIGSFSAASNVTGVKTDMRALGAMLKAHGAWFLADYAAAGPYAAIDMEADRIDAIFLSPHKFVGGPGASGVLVADKRLFGRLPTVPGGGTVSYVTADHHRYVSDIERREEAGTPNVMGDIRAGLAFQLKADVGDHAIEAAEQRAVARAMSAWTGNPAIEVLGPRQAQRLAIFSFNIRVGNQLLHPNLVVALLNDLFGIQARGGCSCAGPYGHELLHIDAARAERYEALVADGCGLFRPGWARLSFNYFFDDAVIDYIIAAVDFLGRRGADFLRLYRADPASGRWMVEGKVTEAGYAFEDLCGWRDAARPAAGEAAPDFARCLAEAERLADEARRATPCAQPEIGESARWFALAG
ncbi:hypothetical protein XM25_22080 [Devosia sp. H5989]|nr:hypothetical protein XM25_22080 [Devosia sp. H5989]